MAITLVNVTGKLNLGSITIPSTTKGNALIVVCAGLGTNPSWPPTLTDNVGDTFTFLPDSSDQADSQTDMGIYLCQHTAGGATTISVSGGNTIGTAWVYEVSGQNIAKASAGATNGVNTPGQGTNHTNLPGPSLTFSSDAFIVATGTDNAGGHSVNSPFTNDPVTGQLSASGHYSALAAQSPVQPTFARQFNSSNWQTSAAAFVDLGPQPCSVFAHLTNPSAPLTDPNSTFIRFVLRGFSGSIPTVGTPAVMIETQKDFPVDATGLVSATLWSNPDITPAGTWWTIEFWNQGKATARFNVLVDCRTSALDLSNIQLPSKIIAGKTGGF